MAIITCNFDGDAGAQIVETVASGRDVYVFYVASDNTLKVKKMVTDPTTTFTIGVTGSVSGITGGGGGSGSITVSASAPTVNDDSDAGYSVGDSWLDTSATPDEMYRAADVSIGAAVWLKTTLTIDELGSIV